MVEISSQHLIFDRGIERITYARDEATAFMPERDSSPPPGQALRSELDTLLNKPTMNDQLNAALRPDLLHRDLLLPRHFRSALDDVRKKLREAVENGDESSEDSQLFGRALRLLSEETKLRDLLSMYRSALYQG